MNLIQSHCSNIILINISNQNSTNSGYGFIDAVMVILVTFNNDKNKDICEINHICCHKTKTSSNGDDHI